MHPSTTAFFHARPSILSNDFERTVTVGLQYRRQAYSNAPVPGRPLGGFVGFLIVAAADHELEDITGAVLGVGSIRAAASAGRALALHTWNGVVLIGTAGVYGLGFGFPPVIVSRRVGWAHAGAQAGLAYVPRSPEPITADPALRAASGLPEADVLTVDAITTDPGIAAAWSQEWEVEHMEAWGVAHAAAQAGVPFAAVLAITNRVGPDAHAEWRSNRARAEAAARDAVRRMLTRLTG